MTNQETAGDPYPYPDEIRSAFLVPVDIDPRGSRDEMFGSAAASLGLGRTRYRQLGEIIRGLSTFEGPVPPQAAYPPLLRSIVAPRLPHTWSRISQMSTGEVLGWPSVGSGKAEGLIAFLASWVSSGADRAADSVTEPPSADESASGGHGLLDALRSVAAWGTTNGYGDMLTALNEAAAGSTDSPSEAVSVVVTTDMEALAGDRVIWWDRDAAVKDLLAQFDDRQLRILQERVLTGALRPTRTLDELGEDLGVTRERIRQIETRARSRLVGLLSSDRYRSLSRAADQVRSKIGAATPIAFADPMVADDPESLQDELLLWMAGPYHRSDGWILRVDLVTIADLIGKAFDEVAENGITRWELLLESACEEGLPLRHFDAALLATPDVVEYGDYLVRWPSTAAGRAQLALRVRGVPMTSEELFSTDPKVERLHSYRNALRLCEDITQVGLDRWGLRVWGADEYPGVVPAMVAVIEERGPVDVDSLADELAERFGVSAASVRIYASTHPVFILVNGSVGLRPADEPYVPKADLVDTKRCFVIGGSWAYRIPVNRDVLRGSGTAIPEAFAVHLGLEPMKTGQMQGPERHVALGWGQSPTIGSIRANVEALGLEEGDIVFARRATAGSLDFVPVRRADLEGATSSQRVKLLVGANPDDPRSAHTVVAEALGMGLASIPSLGAIEARVRSRGDVDVADLLAAFDVSVPR